MSILRSYLNSCLKRFAGTRKRSQLNQLKWLQCSEMLEYRALLSAVADCPVEADSRVEASNEANTQETPRSTKVDAMSSDSQAAPQSRSKKSKFPNVAGTWQFPVLGTQATFEQKKKKIQASFTNGSQQFKGVLKAQKRSTTVFSGKFEVPNGAATILADVTISFPAGQTNPQVCILQAVGGGLTSNANGVRLVT